MHKETVYKMPFDILKIFLFCFSCVVFAIPFLFSNHRLCLNMPSNGIILCIIFMLSALFESFDRLVKEFKLPRKQKVLNVFEIYIFFALFTGVIIFALLDYSIAISATAIICSFAYLVVKFIRLGRILNDFYIG